MTTNEAITVMRELIDKQWFHLRFEVEAAKTLIRVAEENEKNAEDADAWRGLSHG